jgi:hypothetical protein
LLLENRIDDSPRMMLAILGLPLSTGATFIFCVLCAGAMPNLLLPALASGTLILSRLSDRYDREAINWRRGDDAGVQDTTESRFLATSLSGLQRCLFD